MQKLYTEKDFLENQQRQTFTISKKIGDGSLPAHELDEILPGLWHVTDKDNLGVKIISNNICLLSERTSQEIIDMSIEQYMKDIVHPNSHNTVFSNINKLSTSNNTRLVTSYFQKVHFNKKDNFDLYFSTKKIIQSTNQYFTLFHNTKSLGLIAKKLESVLEENYFLKNYYKQFASLTKQETEILRMIVQGVKRNEIADQLHISVYTYDTHRRNLREKLEAKSFKDLLKYAETFGLV